MAEKEMYRKDLRDRENAKVKAIKESNKMIEKKKLCIEKVRKSKEEKDYWKNKLNKVTRKVKSQEKEIRKLNLFQKNAEGKKKKVVRDVRQTTLIEKQREMLPFLGL